MCRFPILLKRNKITRVVNGHDGVMDLDEFSRFLHLLWHNLFASALFRSSVLSHNELLNISILVVITISRYC